MITVLSLNTAIDRVLLIPHFRPGEVVRAERSLAVPGGKGLNVARALRRLGRQVRVIGFLGGVPAPFIRAGCAELGIDQHWIEIAGESRTCVIVVDPYKSAQSVLNEPGPTVSTGETSRLRTAITASLHPGDILCISGSAPPGVPDGFYAALVRDLQPQGIRVLADVSGQALRLAAAERPWALSPNLDEYVAAFSTPDGPDGAARHLARMAEHALITLGARGAVYAGGSTVERFHPPPVEAVNAVGSGDAFVAGFLAGIEEGLPSTDAVRQAIACGASNAARFEPEIGGMEEIRRLMSQVR
jgi:tagatose 6-phosphate kinase